MSERINYYFLLQLPFDPPETDHTIIEQKYDSESKRWRGLAKKRLYLKKKDEIIKTLTDPTLRRKEATDAKKQRDSKLSELEKTIAIYDAGGYSEVTKENLNRLCRDFSDYGWYEVDILRIINKRKKAETEDTFDTISADIDKQLRMYINNLHDFFKNNQNNPVYKKKDPITGDSLSEFEDDFYECSTITVDVYPFIGCKKTDSTDFIKKKLNPIKNKLVNSLTVNAAVTNKQHLIDLCISVLFTDENAKKKYDNYLQLVTKYVELNDFIDRVARAQGNIFPSANLSQYIDLAESTYRLTYRDARKQLERYCAFKGIEPPKAEVVCASCGTRNPEGSFSCTNCGKPLTIICPKCNTSHDNKAVSCRSCGLVFADMSKALPLLEEARKAIADSRFLNAEEALDKASGYWPSHPDIQSLNDKLKEKKVKIDIIYDRFNAAIKNKEIHKAKIELTKLKAAGFPVSKSEEENVERILSEVAASLLSLKSKRGDAAFLEALRLSNLISDDEEVEQCLKRFPPEPVARVSISQQNGGLRIRWSQSHSSCGTIEYRLVRKEVDFSNGFNDNTQETIYQGTELVCSDSNINPFTEYYYSVYVVRSGVFSPVTNAKSPVAYISEPKGLRVIGLDNSISLSWDINPKISSYKVKKSSIDLSVNSIESCEPVECSRLDGLLIRGLENEKKVWIYISSVSTINGREYHSPFIKTECIPMKPAEPLSGVIIEASEDRYICHWNKNKWSVVFFYSYKKPQYNIGTVYSIQDLKYNKLSLTHIDECSAAFSQKFTGELYIIPAVVNGTNVVLSDWHIISNIKAVSNISARNSTNMKGIYLTFDMPADINDYVLLYRKDMIPEGPEDSNSVSIDFTRDIYNRDSSILIDDLKMGTYYISIYSYVSKNGRQIYSSPTSIIANLQRKTDIQYKLIYQKQGLLSKKYFIKIEFSVTDSFGASIPPFVLCAKMRALPMNKNDGYQVCSSKSEINCSGKTVTAEYSISEIPKGTRLKMFFTNDSDYKYFTLKNAGKSEI